MDSLKDPTFRGDLEKPIYSGRLPIRGRLEQFVGLRGGGLGKKEGVVFFEGGRG